MNSGEIRGHDGQTHGKLVPFLRRQIVCGCVEDNRKTFGINDAIRQLDGQFSTRSGFDSPPA